MSAQPTIKAEPTAPNIKPDPDVKESPGDLSDEDIYEDTGDLDFTNADQDVWLARVPRTLWENWNKLDDDEEIQIGTVRVEGGATDIKRVSLRLSDRVEYKDVPKDYTLTRQNVNSKGTSFPTQNSFVFTEKDLPGQRTRAQPVQDENQTRRSFLYEQIKRDEKKRENKKKWEPYTRKTIPKQTSLVAKVRDEFSCLPVENEEYREITERRALEALNKRETKLLGKVSGKMMQPQNLGATSDKSAFSQAAAAAKPPKPKAQENKTARMPQNELLDLVYACFRRHKYWPFKSLKAELKQPEAYLKQTLEIVAHLVKTGDFAMTWELKPEARESSYAGALAYQEAKEELPPIVDDGSDVEMGTDNDYDEANTTFENVH